MRCEGRFLRNLAARDGWILTLVGSFVVLSQTFLTHFGGVGIHILHVRAAMAEFIE